MVESGSTTRRIALSDTVLNIVGFVGTDIDYRRVGEATDLSTFRLASTPRRWDKAQRQFVDGPTNWLTVQCWRIAGPARQGLAPPR